ncbi:oligosaccharyl transferase, archaeosortase A system-associated [Methanoplanus limicola]|uniref:dolichyl-phosphooligosaccharide-protein glycotransferase n=1 Tax=Methanoplanus limicola DSM 2279 TaxID=937775 RepID=H1Z159_9EURY|nr:oligosaccharyl transferase, archaeosortase A system-associated [Methanoplanus limicola]EHQ35326.1 Oligosaccharyl transferase STT3 subunit [Methanoplanus limicola DSM 2279]
MDFNQFKNKRILIIAGLVAVFTLLSLMIRLIPAGNLVAVDGVNLLGNDPWYNLRQIELLISDSLQYPWYDPMTKYPIGTNNFWGPLYPLIAAVMCIVTGAATRTDIMYVSSWLPALMGAAMVPLMYFTGERLSGYKTGLIAAFLAAIVSGQFFYRSLFGFVDHHVAEVFFSTLFCLVILFYLSYVRDNPVNLKDTESLKVPAMIAAGAGFAYFLGLAVMPTMLLFAFIMAVYTGIQFIYDHIKSKPSDFLLLFNVVAFLTAIVLYVALIGIRFEGFDMARYSVGHIFAYLALIAGTVVLYALSNKLSDKPSYYYIGAIFGLAIAGLLALMVVLPDLYTIIVNGLWSFFGYQTTLSTIQEANHWSLGQAWNAFNFGLIMIVLAFFVMVYQFIREHKPELIFTIVWSLVILYATTVQLRYEYYLGANIALMSAFFIAWTLDYGLKDILGFAGIKPQEKVTDEVAEEENSGKKKKKPAKKVHVSKPKTVPAGITVVGVIFLLLFSYFSLNVDLAVSNNVDGINGDWMESLEWMGANTPETGVDYYKLYEKESFEYPEGAYGVMSWWDYGHWITFNAKRMPNANPFQEGVAGENGAAAFFVQTDESASDRVLDNLDTRFVITDIEMDTAKFWAMATWFNPELQQSPYVMNLYQHQEDGSLTPATLYNDKYFRTMISKLHNFDGSLVIPSEVLYVEYVSGDMYGAPLPIISKAEYMPYETAESAVAEFNGKNTKAGAALLSPSVVQPSTKVPALQHYRLVHESPTNLLQGQGSADLKYVKTFEYVPGAKIRGNGIIAINLESDQGRKFTYMQESVNGEFTVPYSTGGDNYGTKVLSDYTVIDTKETFKVSEDAVLNGLYVN